MKMINLHLAVHSRIEDYPCDKLGGDKLPHNTIFFVASSGQVIRVF